MASDERKGPKRTEIKRPNEIKVSDEELREATVVHNLYYDNVARIYSFVRYVLLGLLVVVVIAAAVNSPESISYDNLMFLMKDLGSVAEASGGDFDTIYYNPDTTLSFSGFRNNLAIATSSGLKIYEGDGSTMFEGSDRFTSPRIEESSRYLLLYDFSGNSFAIYNSFARIYTEKLDFAITGADISDSGMFAIASKSKEYNSAVHLYSKSCKVVNRYYSDERVVDISINSSGERVCILAFDAENSDFITKIKLFKPGEDSPITTLELRDVFPLSCRFTTDGNLTVLCDKAAYFYDSEGNLIGSYTQTGEPDSVKLTPQGVVMSMPRNAVSTESDVTVLDGKGNLIFSGTVFGKVKEIDYKNGHLFALAGNVLTRINIKNSEKESTEVSGNVKKMIIYSEKDVMICTASIAEYYEFAN